MQEMWILTLGQEDPLEKEMATHFSFLAWEIPWMEEPGRLQSTGSQNSRTQLSDFSKSSSRKEYVCVLVTQSCPTLQPNGLLQTPLLMGFPRQEYWSGLPFPFPGDLPNPGIETKSTALQVVSFIVGGFITD